MKKNIFTFVIALIINTLCLAQKQWKYDDLKWCQTILPTAMDLLLQKPHLKATGDSVLVAYDDVIVSGGTKWVKKAADRNCLSADPNDCLVWCLVEQPEIKTVRQRKEALSSDKIVEIKKGIFIEKRFYDEAAIETPCQEAAKPTLQKAIIEALIKKKMLRKQQKDESAVAYTLFCESNFAQALTEFQEAEELPEGFWDLQTLQALGVVFPTEVGN
jgi:hypothetical protein